MDSEQHKQVEADENSARATENGSAVTVRQAHKSAPPALTGAEITLSPNRAGVDAGDVEVVLWPEPPEERAGYSRSLWHRAVSHPGALVSLWARDDVVRIVRLTIRSNAAGWRPRWVRWTYAARRAPEIEGGQALAAQDQLSADSQTLTLLLLPEDRRTVNLEFVAALDGETAPGDYAFDVVMTDTQTEAETTFPGMLRLRHPFASFLDNLPTLYRQISEEAPSRFGPYEERPFFERFLRGFEDAWMPLQEMIAGLDRYIDPDDTPADFLPWLASWVALTLDANWPELKRRRLIKEAVELYRWRGTRRSLIRYVEIFAGITPQISDQPLSGMRLGPATLLGQDTLLGNVPPHTFVVTLAVPHPEEIDRNIVRGIIESVKPAHTAYELRIVERAATSE